MAGTYVAPDFPVSASWQSHKDRNPPSQEPGTDYATPYGTSLFAPAAGRIADRKDSNSGGTGRYLTIDLDDGRRVRMLHLDSSAVGVGARVKRGQRIATSGASGHGSDWGYGAHVHVTLFPSWTYDFSRTLDFELYVGEEPTPPPIEEDEEIMVMRGANYVRASDGATVRLLFNSGSGWYSEFQVNEPAGPYVNPIAEHWETNPWPTITESHAAAIKRDCDELRRTSIDLTDIPGSNTASVWRWSLVGVLLLLVIAQAVDLFAFVR